MSDLARRTAPGCNNVNGIVEDIFQSVVKGNPSGIG
jgi:hypothetical protein